MEKNNGFLKNTQNKSLGIFITNSVLYKVKYVLMPPSIPDLTKFNLFHCLPP